MFVQLPFIFLSHLSLVGFLQVLMPFISFSLDETFFGLSTSFTSSYPPLLSVGCGSSMLDLLRRTTTVNRKQSSPPHTKTTCRPRNLHTQNHRWSWTFLLFWSKFLRNGSKPQKTVKLCHYDFTLRNSMFLCWQPDFSQMHNISKVNIKHLLLGK